MSEKALVQQSAIKEYLVLTKPGIVSLVLITTLGGMYLGSRGELDPVLVFWTLTGTGLAAAGSAVLNMVIDRDVDALMGRTAHRPLPKGSVSVQKALVFGAFLQALSLGVMLLFVGLLPALLVALASFSYIVLYSLLLKRRSPLSTEIGGISGALPPVIGYVSASGELDVNAFALFLLMFMWQPPHFWVLALKYREDYKKAGIPTLPVARGVFVTKVKTLIYTASLFPVSLIPYFTGMVGELYLASALVMNALYLALTLRFVFSREEESMRLFFFSIIYLAVLFGMMIVDMVKV
ncbi:MAG: protoheme IX farnesyltransferase [Aquificae bacterium]|nr:protoheme IX farnesyltransferase [Aquificota bacterium]